MKINLLQQFDDSEFDLLESLLGSDVLNIYTTEIIHYEGDTIHCFEPPRIIIESNGLILEFGVVCLVNLLELTTYQLCIKKLDSIPLGFKLRNSYHEKLSNIKIYTFNENEIELDNTKIIKLFSNQIELPNLYYSVSFQTFQLVTFESKSSLLFALEANDGWDSCITKHTNESSLNFLLEKYNNRKVVVCGHYI